MKDTIVCIEQIPEYFSSDLRITITCKQSDVYEAQAIINHLSSIINITLERSLVIAHKDYSLLRDIGAVDLLKGSVERNIVAHHGDIDIL